LRESTDQHVEFGNVVILCCDAHAASELGQKWSNTNRSLGSRHSTEMNRREVPIGDIPLYPHSAHEYIDGGAQRSAVSGPTVFNRAVVGRLETDGRERVTTIGGAGSAA